MSDPMGSERPAVSRKRQAAEREAALRFLLERVDYERAHVMPSGGQELKLDRMRELLQRLGDPQRGLPIVHVAGTKGKGSTAATIAAIMTAAGYSSGLFTSPHLDRLEERVAIDGRCCPSQTLVQLIDEIRPAAEAMDRIAAATPGEQGGPTFFELTTALALLYFARRKIDLAVLEVGLGGRLDSTNVCTPQVAAITSISLDHTEQLGDTLAAIAREKAGIIKPGVPLVSGVTQEEPREVIREACRRRGARLVELGADFDFHYEPPRHLERRPQPGRLDFSLLSAGPASSSRNEGPGQGLANLSLGLLGRHQAANAAVALAAVAELRRAGWKIPEAAIRAALAGLTWPARVEVVARRPAVVLDAAHNVASVEALLRTLDESFSASRRLLIFGTTREKDARGMLHLLLPRFDHVVLTQYRDNPRAVPPEELQAAAAALSGRQHAVYDDPPTAWEAIRPLAAPDDLVCITGSFYLAAELRRAMQSRPLGLPVAVTSAP
jgi:dihydrofolate synthase/folylpolyglutamate synthase